MAETLKNPSVITIANPISLDKAIQQVQASLGSLAWLQKVFGRARIHPRKDAKNEMRREPMVYQGKGEYYPVLANDALQSYSFFRVKGAREFDDVGNHNLAVWETANLDLIVWGNLKAIDSTKDYIFTDELIEDVKALLMVEPCCDIVRVWDEDMREIYKGYTLKEDQRDLILYPYFAFKIELVLKYEMSCQN